MSAISLTYKSLNNVSTVVRLEEGVEKEMVIDLKRFPFGVKVVTVTHNRILKVYRNVTEVHYAYSKHIIAGDAMAIESDILSQGEGSILASDIKEILMEPETSIDR